MIIKILFWVIAFGHALFYGAMAFIFWRIDWPLALPDLNAASRLFVGAAYIVVALLMVFVIAACLQDACCPEDDEDDFPV